MQSTISTTMRVICVAATMTLAGGGTALADLTHKQVWEAIREWSAAFDQQVAAATQQVQGDTLVLTGVTFDSDVDGAKTVVTVPEIRLQQMAAESVQITMAENSTIQHSVESSFFSPASNALMRLSQNNTNVIVTGTPEQMTFATQLDSMSLTLVEYTEGGAAQDIDFTLSIADLTENSVLRLGEEIGVTSTTRVGSVAISVDDKSDGPDGTGRFDGQINGVTIAASMDNAQLFSDDDMQASAALEAGFAVSLQFDMGDSQFSFAQEADGDASGGTMSWDSAGIGFGMGGTRMTAQMTMGALSLNATSAMAPAPIDYTLEDMALSIDMPVLITPEAVPFSAALRMVGLSLGDDFWGVFDPSSAVPRDPASIILAFSGAGRWTDNILDDAPDDTDAPSGEIESLSIDEMNLAVGGAELTGEGAFTFDNTDLTTFDGMPRPEGRMGLTLRGGQTFLNALVAAGLLPQDQAFFGQMMLGALARSAGEDFFVSEIVISEDGSVLANGMPLPF